jgi:predicted dehydrogenase
MGPTEALMDYNTTPKTDRRSFVQTSAAGLSILAPATVFGSQANSALTIGLVGCGNRGMYVSGIFAKNEFARVAAICDIYDDRIKAGQEKYSGAKVFKDIKDLLASDVDAVLIATPAVLHPEHFELAVKARKHIFMEKPAAVDGRGCLRVMKAARMADPSKRISCDFQQRYGTDYRKAYEIVKSGELGPIKMVKAAWLGGGPPIKKGHPASEEKIRNWFFYREMSGDILIEQDCHNIDVVNWFTGTHPNWAAGCGSRMIRTDIGDIFDNVAISFKFQSGLNFSYAASQFGRQIGWQDVGEYFLCEKGTVHTTRQGVKIYRGDRKEVEEYVTKYDITQDAVNQFIEGARTGKIENAAFQAAESTLTAWMALQAAVKGRPITWEEAQKL